MSRSCNIRTFEDITKSSLRSLLQSLHGREDVVIADVGPFDGTGLVNAGFQSDIMKATVKYALGGEQERELNMLVKLPATNVLRFTAKATRVFRHEVLWYTRHLPAAAAESSLVRDMCPACYLGYFEDDVPAVDSKSCWPYACAMAFGKLEKGVLILEDLTKAERPYRLLEKAAVPSVEVAGLVLTALAHFHGFWWRFLNGSAAAAGTSGGEVTREEILLEYKCAWRPFMFKQTVVEVLKMACDLLGNRDEDYVDLVRR